MKRQTNPDWEADGRQRGREIVDFVFSAAGVYLYAFMEFQSAVEVGIGASREALARRPERMVYFVTQHTIEEIAGLLVSAGVVRVEDVGYDSDTPGLILVAIPFRALTLPPRERRARLFRLQPTLSIPNPMPDRAAFERQSSQFAALVSAFASIRQMNRNQTPPGK